MLFTIKMKGIIHLGRPQIAKTCAPKPLFFIKKNQKGKASGDPHNWGGWLIF